MTMTRSTLGDDDIAAFAAEAKVGLVATVNPEGLPHISLLTSLRARDETHLTFGEFCAGQSKLHVRQNPRCGFVVMGLDRRLWRGRAVWTHACGAGADYILYNNQALFRYNAYTGFHTIHYLDLVEVAGPTPLSVSRLLAGGLRARFGASLSGNRDRDTVLKPWARGLIARIDSLKFVATVDEEGFPSIEPLLPCYPAGGSRVVVNGGRALSAVGPEQPVALFVLSLEMESVLLRGRLVDRRGSGLAVLAIDWVYNSMLPVTGQIYPSPPLGEGVG